MRAKLFWSLQTIHIKYLSILKLLLPDNVLLTFAFGTFGIIFSTFKLLCLAKDH